MSWLKKRNFESSQFIDVFKALRQDEIPRGVNKET